jgi:hypothetical protein
VYAVFWFNKQHAFDAVNFKTSAVKVVVASILFIRIKAYLGLMVLIFFTMRTKELSINFEEVNTLTSLNLLPVDS